MISSFYAITAVILFFTLLTIWNFLQGQSVLKNTKAAVNMTEYQKAIILQDQLRRLSHAK
jgi:hypothetical protein